MTSMYSRITQDDGWDIAIETQHEKRVQELISDINMIYSGHYADSFASESLLKLLNIHSNLPHDICYKIVDLLPRQYQLIDVYSNAISYDSTYSFIEFTALLINNLIHYALFIFILFYLENLNLVYPILLLLLSITETVIICYTYRTNKFSIIGWYYFKNVIEKNWRIQHQIINFFTGCDLIITSCVYLPITIILITIKTNNHSMYLLIISLYFSSFIITFTYKCYMNKRRIIFQEGLINPAIYMPIIGLISLIISIFYHESISLIIISLIIIFIGFIVHAISRPQFTSFAIRKMSLCEFILMYSQIVVCILFGFELYYDHNVYILSIFILVFSLIYILLLYAFLVSESIDDDGGDGNDPFYDRESDLYYFRHIVDIFINVPIFIMLIYYLYDSHNNNNDLSLWWYLCITITAMYRLFGTIYFFGVDDDGDMWILGLSQCFVITTIQFSGIVIMSIVYLSTGTVNKSDGILFILSIIFIVMGVLMCCCLIPFSTYYLWFFAMAFYDDD